MRRVWLVGLCAVAATACGSTHSSSGGSTITFRVPSAAMEPTLSLGRSVRVAISSSYVPQVGDIIALHPPSGATDVPPRCGSSHQGSGHRQACAVPTPGASTQTFIKRIVAGPGDTVAIVGGHVIRNGKPDRDSAYIKPCPGGDPICSFPAPVRIPRGDYFVLGDNRGESADSRFWGPVARPLIIGRVEG